MPSHGFQKYFGRFQLVFGKSSRPALAHLEDGDAVALLAQAQRRHAAAEAGADDREVVVEVPRHVPSLSPGRKTEIGSLLRVNGQRIEERRERFLRRSWGAAPPTPEPGRWRRSTRRRQGTRAYEAGRPQTGMPRPPPARGKLPSKKIPRLPPRRPAPPPRAAHRRRPPPLSPSEDSSCSSDASRLRAAASRAPREAASRTTRASRGRMPRSRTSRSRGAATRRERARDAASRAGRMPETRRAGSRRSSRESPRSAPSGAARWDRPQTRRRGARRRGPPRAPSP